MGIVRDVTSSHLIHVSVARVNFSAKGPTRNRLRNIYGDHALEKSPKSFKIPTPSLEIEGRFISVR